MKLQNFMSYTYVFYHVAINEDRTSLCTGHGIMKIEKGD